MLLCLWHNLAFDSTLILPDRLRFIHITVAIFKPYQLITHMFLHGGFLHILFNMYALWLFGSVLERIWGAKKFLIFYFVCGLAAGLAEMFFVTWGAGNWRFGCNNGAACCLCVHLSQHRIFYSSLSISN